MMNQIVKFPVLVSVIACTLISACGGDANPAQPSLVVADDEFSVAPLSADGAGASVIDVLANDRFAGLPVPAGAGGNVRLELLAPPDGVTVATDGRLVAVARYSTGRVTIAYRACTLKAPDVCATAKATVTVTRGPVLALPLMVRGWTGDVVVDHTDLKVEWPDTVPNALRVSTSGAVRIADSATPGRYALRRHLCEPGVAQNCIDQDIVVEVPQTVAVYGDYPAGELTKQPLPAPWWSGGIGGMVNWGDVDDYCFWTTGCIRFAAPFSALDLPVLDGNVSLSVARPLYWPMSRRWPARAGQRTRLPASGTLYTEPWVLLNEAEDYWFWFGLRTGLIRRYSQGSQLTPGALPPDPANPDVPLRWATGSLHRADGSRPEAARVALGRLGEQGQGSGPWPSVDLQVEIDGRQQVLDLLAGVFFDVRDDGDVELAADGGFALRLPPLRGRTMTAGSLATMFRFDVAQSRWLVQDAIATVGVDGAWRATVARPGLWAVARPQTAVQVTGCVADPWGRPAPQATVQLRDTAGTHRAVSITDDRGRFSALVSANSTIEVSAEGAAPGSTIRSRAAARLIDTASAGAQDIGPCLAFDVAPLLGYTTVGPLEDGLIVDLPVLVQPDGTTRRSAFAADWTALQVGRYSVFSRVTASSLELLEPGPTSDIFRNLRDRVMVIRVPSQAPIRVSLAGAERHREVEGRHWHLFDIEVAENCAVEVVPRRVLVDALPVLGLHETTVCQPR